ncbi:hypothetical protein ACT3CD_01305 [Geofilum sp. OHC36d9]|uniref:hypothetical protein n=1 Tax=Geofilum sp. OHC36d9 TaxID=3458413 RepID=UPI004033EDFF
MKHLFLLLFLFFEFVAFGQVTEYFDEYRVTRTSDLSKEKKLLNETEHLTEILLPYFNDSLFYVRQKAYSFIFRKGMSVAASEKASYIILLLKGCDDADGGIIGQNMMWLQSFSRSDYTDDAKFFINKLLNKKRLPHRKRLIMLAGYVGAGKEILQRQLLQQNLSSKERWYIHLALARLGVQQSIDFCSQTFDSLPLDNNLVEYVMPDIIYTRQKALLDLCIEHLNSDQLACMTADPDNEKPVLCGYRILELLAPVIESFPIGVSAIGGLDTPDYRAALLTARQWFFENQDFHVRADFF